MASGVVTVGRRQYASGLYWENSPSGRISQAAKEAARQPGHQATFFAVRPGGKSGRVPQFALSQSVNEHKVGMPVLAGCLANQQPGSWAGAFRLREGTAVVVVRDDLIVPDGDQFFMDETEARDRLLQEMALGGLQRIYAPETWGVPGADTMPISLLINERTDIKLRSVSVSSRGLMAVGVGLLALLLLLGLGWYIQRQNELAEEEQQRSLQALERAKLEAQKMMPSFMQAPPKYPPPERKWEKHPRPIEVFKACEAGLAKVPAGVAGWQLVAMSCDASSLSTNWMRTTGPAVYPPQWIASETGSNADFIVSFPSIEARGAEELVGSEEVMRRYLQQNWPGNISRLPDDPPPPPPPDYKGEWNPPPPPWVKRSFTVSVPVLPWTVPSLFADLPGVVVDTIKFSASGAGGGSWTVEGVIYENRR